MGFRYSESTAVVTIIHPRVGGDSSLGLELWVFELSPNRNWPRKYQSHGSNFHYATLVYGCRGQPDEILLQRDYGGSNDDPLGNQFLLVT